MSGQPQVPSNSTIPPPNSLSYNPWALLSHFPFAPPLGLHNSDLFNLYHYYYNSPFHFYPKILELNKRYNHSILPDSSDIVGIHNFSKSFRLPDSWVATSSGNTRVLNFACENSGLKFDTGEVVGDMFIGIIPKEPKEIMDHPFRHQREVSINQIYSHQFQKRYLLQN